MLTITGNIAKALASQSPQIIPLVEITDQDANVHLFMGGAEHIATADNRDYIQNIASITPVAVEIDPITRKAQGSTITITMVDDGAIRQIMETQPLKNATVVVKLTCGRFVTSSAAGYWGGLVADIVPRGGLIDIVCLDALAVVFDYYYYGLLMNRHPLEYVSDMLAARGVPAALIDSTSLEPDTDTAVSHFVVNTHWTPTARNAIGAVDVAGTVVGTEDASSPAATVAAAIIAMTEALDYGGAVDDEPNSQTAPAWNIGKTIAEIAKMLYGTIAPDTAGAVGFKRFDPTATVVATWTADDIVSLEQTSIYDDMINEVRVPLTSGRVQETYVYRDTASQAQHNIPGAATYAAPYVLDLPMACQEFWLAGAKVSAAETSGPAFVLSHLRLSGMCGTRVVDAFRHAAAATTWDAVKPFTRVPAASLTVGLRDLYLKMDGEVLKASSLTFPVDTYWDLLDVDGNGEVLTTHTFHPTRLALGGTVTRAVGGAAEEHTPYRDHASPFYDVTVARHVAAAIVARAANGIPRLAIETTFAQYAIELGDLVAVADPVPMMWSVDGLTSANLVKWEAVSKEADLLRGIIRWGLAFASIHAPPWSATVADVPIDPAYAPDSTGAPNISVSLAAPQAIGSKIWTVVAYDSTEWEVELAYDLATNTITVGRTGAYMVSAQVLVLGLAAGAYCQAGISKILVDTTVVAVANGAREYNDSTAARDTTCAVQHPGIYMLAGQKIQITAWNDGAATTISGDPLSTWLIIRYLG